jgi:hypothetical protein
MTVNSVKFITQDINTYFKTICFGSFKFGQFASLKWLNVQQFNIYKSCLKYTKIEN